MSNLGNEMISLTQFSKVTLVAALAFGSVPATAFSEEQAAVTDGRAAAVENFEAGDPALMLGGQVDLVNQTPPWLVSISGGKLFMENKLEPLSLHYNDIGWVQFPGTDVLASTDGAVVSATVDVKNMGKGGAGIFVGSGKAGTYLFFSVDGQGQYHVLRKDGRSLRALRSAKHVAIHAGAPNELAFELRGANVVFFANGTEIIKVPNENGMASAGRGNDQAGVGLAAFGIGVFSFDDVEIVRPD